MSTTTNENKTERIMDVDLSMRAKNILRREGIHTIDDLCNLNRMELSVLRGCGHKTEKEILDFLAEQGLALAPEEGKTIPVEVSYDTYNMIHDRIKNYYLTKPSEKRFSEGDTLLFTVNDSCGAAYPVKRKILSISRREEGLVNGYIILGF